MGRRQPGLGNLLPSAGAPIAPPPAEALELEGEIGRLVAAAAPWLPELPGWGRSAPPRCRDDPATRAYAARRRAEGKSPREIRRCIKRAVARNLFKLLLQLDRADVEVVRVC
jgi:hypothetical protein